MTVPIVLASTVAILLPAAGRTAKFKTIAEIARLVPSRLYVCDMFVTSIVMYNPVESVRDRADQSFKIIFVFSDVLR